jgi:hypothetical protein
VSEAGFQFIEATHTYLRGGLVIPSATRCIDHAGLTSYDNVRRDILDRKSDNGKKVHAATHYYDEGDLDLRSISDVQRGYLDSWIEWRTFRNFSPVLIEQQQIATLYAMSFGMTLDRWGFLDKYPTIVELKTSVAIEAWHGIQTALYAAGVVHPKLIASNSMSPQARFLTTRRVVVQLRPDGKKAHERFFEDRKDFDVATWALGITHWKLSHGKKIEEIREAA